MTSEEKKAKKAAYDRVYQDKNREKKRAYDKAYCLANREKKNAQSLEWFHSHPEKRFNTVLKGRFNINVEIFNDKVIEQGNVCAISGQPPSDKTLCIDHDRACCPGNKSCGKCVRGLLHRKINAAMGLFEDNPEWLRAAADYIEFWKKKSKPV
jgi:hypothetical protein